ncbi:gluconokinase [Lichenibacterium ramalinae]|uniref:Gluconokinase n=1 Tax=Lichenibacterium ramalinae TaxID=2316527 RepID=A0A4Q2RJB1_9HYPH|nr:gluconokinase [Lichenibacterium ramalinae]RYB06432.1 gluconokinase [Lichenibacterium ramalinae]
MPAAPDPKAPLPVVVMGVSGSGKSTVAAQLAGRIGLPYIDGDDLHPQSNVDKMHAGTPLDDEDRWPWLDRVAATLNERSAGQGGVILACSALKRAYRDRLRTGTGGNVRFAFLDVDMDEIERRLKRRVHHFMPAHLLQSQFDTLERPGPDETDVLTVPAHGPAEDLVADLARRLGR